MTDDQCRMIDLISDLRFFDSWMAVVDAAAENIENKIIADKTASSFLKSYEQRSKITRGRRAGAAVR